MKVWVSDNPDPLTVIDGNVLDFAAIWKTCMRTDSLIAVTVKTGKKKTEKLYLNPHQVTTIGE
ncbi:hypothetical protein PBI_GRAYSON_235 [Rhodococcus phage Grayson]|nr:hypothetical protein PBI_GRAYSON_235 [Rhodococcus phage Grayson]